MTDINTDTAQPSRPGAEVVAKVAAAFGKPVLLITESEEAYLYLRKALVDDLAPEGAVEATLTLRYADCCWRIQRYQRVAAGAVNLTFKYALKTVLGEHATVGIEGLTPEQIADGWFRDSKIKALALEHLKRFAVDEATITAQAFAMRSSELAVVDEMQARAEAEALAILRELDRRKESRARVIAAQVSRGVNITEAERIAVAPGTPSAARLNQ